MTVCLHVVLAIAGLKSQVNGQHGVKRPNVNPFCRDLRLKEAVLIVLRPSKGVTRRLSHPFLRRGGEASARLSPYHSAEFLSVFDSRNTYATPGKGSCPHLWDE
jgi:hypothetical protein